MDRKYWALIVLVIMLLWLAHTTREAAKNIIEAAVLPILTTILFFFGMISWLWWLIIFPLSWLFSKSMKKSPPSVAPPLESMKG